jgi:pimeloyl-ACP methyl ester carboxylesterase
MLTQPWQRLLRFYDRLRFAHTPCWLIGGRPSLAAPQPRRRELLVFVHGIYGSDMGGVDIGNFGDWPVRLQADPRFAGRCDLRLFAYRSFNLGSDPAFSVPGHARRLLADLLASGAEGYQRIHFIVHSMGGLILRQALLDLQAQPGHPLLAQVAGLFVLATPAGGSNDAAILSRLGVSHLEAVEMAPGSRFLKRQQKAWDAAFKARIMAPGGAWKPGRWWLALGAELKAMPLGRVVEPASVLAMGKHSAYQAFDLDHLQMARSDEDNLAVYEWVAGQLDGLPRHDVKKGRI